MPVARNNITHAHCGMCGSSCGLACGVNVELLLELLLDLLLELLFQAMLESHGAAIHAQRPLQIYASGPRQLQGRKYTISHWQPAATCISYAVGLYSVTMLVLP
jgi:hypothetical protein